MMQKNKRDLRQAKCIRRGKTARLYGRLLIPVALIGLSQSLWTDPVAGPQLVEGLEEIRPIIATYAQNTPLEDVFGPAPEPEEKEPIVAINSAGQAAVDGEEAALSVSYTLPVSVRPVNRPQSN